MNIYKSADLEILKSQQYSHSIVWIYESGEFWEILPGSIQALLKRDLERAQLQLSVESFCAD